MFMIINYIIYIFILETNSTTILCGVIIGDGRINMMMLLFMSYKKPSYR